MKQKIQPDILQFIAQNPLKLKPSGLMILVILLEESKYQNEWFLLTDADIAERTRLAKKTIERHAEIENLPFIESQRLRYKSNFIGTIYRFSNFDFLPELITE